MFRDFNSWELFKASFEVLRQDRELLWFPVLSSLATLLVIGSFMVPLFSGVRLLRRSSRMSRCPSASMWACLLFTSQCIS